MIIWVVKIIFVQFFCVFFPPLLNIFCFCEVPTISLLIEPLFAWNVPLVSLSFLKRSLVFPILLLSLFLCIDHWERLFYLSLLFFGTLHSNGYIFPFLLCFSFPFFSQLFVRPPRSADFLFCVSFSWGWSWFLAPIQCHEPPSIVHQALYQIYSLKSISHFHCILVRDLI